MEWLTGLLGTVAGGWQALLLKIAGVVIVAGLVFGGGYYVGEQSIVKPLATATQNVALAQHKQDLVQHQAAETVTVTATKQHAAGDAATKVIVQTIHDLPSAECALSPDQLKALNDAGKQ